MRPRTLLWGRLRHALQSLTKCIDLIDQCQKLIHIADNSDYCQKTVGEYPNNELTDNDQDAKKMKKSRKRSSTENSQILCPQSREGLHLDKESQVTGKHNCKLITVIQPFFCIRRKLFSPFFFFQGRSKEYRFTSIFKWEGFKMPQCFSCREPGHWRNECSLLAVPGVQEEGKKLTDNLTRAKSDDQDLNIRSYSVGTYAFSHIFS